MKLRKLGFLAAVLAAFGIGTKTGVKYAKDHYVARNRKFIESEPIRDEK